MTTIVTVEGAYDCITRTPLGEQASIFTVIRDGDDRFHGTNAHELGSLTIEDGRIDGNCLTWTMTVTEPMQLILKGEAFIEGDRLFGTLEAGPYGISPMSGSRRT